MSLVPFFDLKFLARSPQKVQEFQIGGTSRGVSQALAVRQQRGLTATAHSGIKAAPRRLRTGAAGI